LENAKEFSKLADTFNLTLNKTKLIVVDKQRNHYERAPILSFLYEQALSVPIHSHFIATFVPLNLTFPSLL
jgi:hypothetical protein